MNPVERRRTRLRTVSRWGSRLCIAFMVALPVGLVAIWAVEPDVLARGYAAEAEARGWRLEVLDIAEGGKPNALNRGDAA
ncbi:MAG: hypothetical protein AAFR79_10235, partial [Pseudomonadota bacterium]